MASAETVTHEAYTIAMETLTDKVCPHLPRVDLRGCPMFGAGPGCAVCKLPASATGQRLQGKGCCLIQDFDPTLQVRALGCPGEPREGL